MRREVLGDEEDIHQREDLANGPIGFLLAPKGRPVVDVEGDGGALFLKAVDQLQRGAAGNLAEGGGDAADVEGARLVEGEIGYVLQAQMGEAGVRPVVEHRGLARVGAHLVVVDAEPGVGLVGKQQVIVAHARKADAVFHNLAQGVVRQRRDDARAQAEGGGAAADVEFRAAGGLAKGIRKGDAVLVGRREAQHHLSVTHQIKGPFVHG